MVSDAGRRMHKEALAVSDALRTKSDGQASLVVFTSENFSIISTILLLAVLEHVSISIAKIEEIKCVSEDNGWVIELYVLGGNIES